MPTTKTTDAQRLVLIRARVTKSMFTRLSAMRKRKDLPTLSETVRAAIARGLRVAEDEQPPRENAARRATGG